MNYSDPGADHYEQKYRERVIKQLHRRAAEFGFELHEVECVFLGSHIESLMSRSLERFRRGHGKAVLAFD
jgi:hypothetical protein